MRIFSLGENAVTVELGDEISDVLNRRAIALSRDLEARPFDGFIEAVPAYASVTAFFDVGAVRRAKPGISAWAAVRDELKERLIKLPDGDADVEAGRLIEVPVDFSQGPDREAGAERCGMPVEQFVTIFTERTYRVYMLGFYPGFAYMGEVDERIELPRLATPRMKVPKGSVGIAGRQTGIYPIESPGGWQLIGRTDVELFTPEAEPPTLFAPGDMCRFVAVKR